MIAEISSKLAAFVVALMMNGMLITGVAYMFNVEIKQQTAGIADSGQGRLCGCTPHGGDRCRCSPMSRL
jgi:hypothetical protein